MFLRLIQIVVCISTLSFHCLYKPQFGYAFISYWIFNYFLLCMFSVLSWQCFLAGYRTFYMSFYDFNFSFISLISFFFVQHFSRFPWFYFSALLLQVKNFLVTIFLISSIPFLFSGYSFFIRSLFYISLGSRLHCAAN